MDKDKLRDHYEVACRWCKYYRGKNDPIVCDNDNPCLTTEALSEMRKIAIEMEE